MHRLRLGFTLIELLVVIAIVGILSSVVLASLNSARKKGRDARRISDIKQLQLALELYYDSYGTYPADLSAANLATPPDNAFLSAVPVDPSTGNSYYYDFPAAQCGTGSYHVGADLESDASSNQALNSDSDKTTTTISGTDDGNRCDDTGSGYSCYDICP